MAEDDCQRTATGDDHQPTEPRVCVDATTLIALGSVGELDALSSLDGRITVLPAVQEEVTTEPARANLDRFLDRDAVDAAIPSVDGAGAGDAPATDDATSDATVPDADALDERARTILDESGVNGDVRLVAAVLRFEAEARAIGIVSDDRRLRTVARGLGATVTGTIGVIVRSVEEGRSADEAKRLLERLDDRGLHMTAELRQRAMELVEAAGE